MNLAFAESPPASGRPPLKILHIYSSPSDGGATVSIAGLCSAFTDRGHRVAVACRAGADLLNRLDHRIPVCRLPLRGALDLASLYRLDRFIRTQDLDWINAHNGRDYPVAYMASRMTGAHCAFWRRYYRLNRNTLTRALFRRAD
ncbi:MAG: glycosyltransferase, partial [Gammaproteobacteria bacterium]|nr:glycosyltransferase [Gammaproteobacteria bacterium]